MNWTISTNARRGLVEAPNPEAASAVHREAHGLVADQVLEVQEGS